MKVLCVTPNIAIDRFISVPGFHAGGVWRSAATRVVCGGKGLNVARALKRLDHEPVCAGMLAGHQGRLVVDEARREGLNGVWTWIEGETRVNVIIVGNDGNTTVINDRGPTVSTEDWSRLVADVEGAAQSVDGVCLCGSLPPSCPQGGLSALIAAAGKTTKRPVWVDTSGLDVLTEAMAAAPHGIKINGDEAASLLGRPIASMSDARRAVLDIRSRGPSRVVITLGKAGAVLVSEEGQWSATPPHIDAVNAVGSGDCFLAGLVSGQLAGKSPIEALRLATACGAVNALRRDTIDIDPSHLAWALGETKVDRIDA